MDLENMDYEMGEDKQLITDLKSELEQVKTELENLKNEEEFKVKEEGEKVKGAVNSNNNEELQ